MNGSAGTLARRASGRCVHAGAKVTNWVAVDLQRRSGDWRHNSDPIRRARRTFRTCRGDAASSDTPSGHLHAEWPHISDHSRHNWPLATHSMLMPLACGIGSSARTGVRAAVTGDGDLSTHRPGRRNHAQSTRRCRLRRLHPAAIHHSEHGDHARDADNAHEHATLSGAYESFRCPSVCMSAYPPARTEGHNSVACVGNDRDMRQTGRSRPVCVGRHASADLRAHEQVRANRICRASGRVFSPLGRCFVPVCIVLGEEQLCRTRWPHWETAVFYDRFIARRDHCA